ncbi:MAG TPA: 50S ribosomal protein L30 [Thermotogota bacterium]|nr:50S ribosomal protein L30 [Thermotogota bacterium]HPJ88161.1 50S ribosomal protein L30 [Thermotogota bacterium]HPR95594.1 50S ribosomal protein L30 [Thermotogota bacterium]
MAKLKITLTKSPVGYNRDQRATADALGLGKMNTTVTKEDNPAIRGMIFKIKHLLTVEEV